MADETTTAVAGAGAAPATEAAPRWDSGIWHEATPGQFKPKWQESLPDNFEPYKSFLQTFDSLEGMVKSHKDFMTKARTQGGVRPLSAESTDEEKLAYRKAFGIPDEPYQFEKPKELPEGLEWQEEKAKTFGSWAQENNLTPTQAKAAMDLYLKLQGDDVRSYQEKEKQYREQMNAQEQEVLRTEFGGKLDGTVLKAKQAALKYGIPVERLDPKDQGFLGVTMLKVMSDLASALGESEIPNAAVVVNADPYRQAQAMWEPGSPHRELLRKGDKATQDKYYALLQQAKKQGTLPRDMD